MISQHNEIKYTLYFFSAHQRGQITSIKSDSLLLISGMKRVSMSRINISKTTIRLAALGLLLLSSLGPWFADTHPARQETCTAPLVWVGDGHCACLITLIMFYRTGDSSVWWLGLPPLLPIFFTLLYFLVGNHRFLWYFHLAGWFFVAFYSLFWFIIGWSSGQQLFLWGAGVCGAVAVSLLVWELRTAKSHPDQDLLQSQ